MTRWLSIAAVCVLTACINDVAAVPCGGEDCPAQADVAAFDPECEPDFDAMTPPDTGPHESVVELAVDADQIYLMTLHAVYSVPRGGGAPVELFARNPNSGATLAALWLREHDLVVYQDAANIFAVPKRGGHVTRLPELERMRDGTFSARDARGASGWNQVADADGRVYRELWMLDVEGMQVSVLGRIPAPAGADPGAIGSEHIFWTDNPNQVTPDTRLYSMSIEAGAAATLVPVLPELSRRLMLFGVASNQLYLLGHEANAAPRLLRLPIAGGALEDLGEVPGVDDHVLSLQLASTSGGVLLNLQGLQTDGPLQRYWLANADEKPAALPCLGPREESAFVVVDHELISAVRSPGGRVSVVRRWLR